MPLFRCSGSSGAARLVCKHVGSKWAEVRPGIRPFLGCKGRGGGSRGSWAGPGYIIEAPNPAPVLSSPNLSSPLGKWSIRCAEEWGRRPVRATLHLLSQFPALLGNLLGEFYSLLLPLIPIYYTGCLKKNCDVLMGPQIQVFIHHESSPVCIGRLGQRTV